jgi:hypothetical protein
MVILLFVIFADSNVQATCTPTPRVLLEVHLRNARGFHLLNQTYTLGAIVTDGRLEGDRSGIWSALGTARLFAAFLVGHGHWPMTISIVQRLSAAQATISPLVMGFAWDTAGLIFASRVPE